MEKISIIVPCYNEQETIERFYNEVCAVSADLKAELEIVFVNDGSDDATLGIMKEAAARDSRVKYISFSRNFGKESAVYAGLKNVTGDYIVIMDADLQDPPSLLPKMYDLIKSGEYDCIATRRVTRRGEAAIRSFCAKCFYKLINKISQTEIVDGARDFRMMTRQMVDSVLELSEYNRFSKGLFAWVGYNTMWLEYDNVERSAGQTKWSFWKLFKYSIDGIVGFSTVPLAISSLLGIVLFLVSIIGIVFVIVRQLLYGGSAYGWASMICVILLVSGLQLLCIGIVSIYLSKTYLESKNRPIYIVKEDNIKKN